MPAFLGRRGARALVLALAVGLPLAAAAIEARHELAPEGIGTDDAHIFLRYGRNLARGEGFVWNPGGEAVEGATSTLWTLAAAAGYLVANDPSDLLFAVALVALAAALAAWIAAALDLVGARAEPGPALAAAAGAAVALAADLAARPSFAVWTAASLMDGGVWCAAMLAAAATLVRAARPEAGGRALAAAALAQVVLALARPEALAAGPLLLAAAALAGRVPLRRWLAPAAAALAAQGALALWRLATFGWPLPNTYYAKVGAALGPRLAAGAEYLRGAANDDPTLEVLWGLAAVVLGVLCLERLRRSRPAWIPARAAPALAVAAAATLLGPAIVLFEGGDYFPGHRTLVQLRPFAASLLLLLAAAALGLRLRPDRARAAAALTLLLAAAGAYAGGEARWGRLLTTTFHKVDFDAARGGYATGERLNRLFAAPRRPPTVGVLAAGALPLVYRGPSRDLLGLNDAAIAHASRTRHGLHGHAAFAASPFFAAPPEIVLVGPPVCTGRPVERTERRLAFRLVLADLDRDPRFRAAYRLVRLLDPASGEPVLCTFARADWLAAGAAGAGWDRAPEPPAPVPPPARGAPPGQPIE